MPARGTPITIPDWWWKDFTAELARRGLRAVDLAQMLVPTSLAGELRTRAMNAAQVKVKRFLDGDNRTAELLEALRIPLGLPRFDFRAANRSQADAIERVLESPNTASRDLAAGRLLVSLESGELRLDDLLKDALGDHSDPVKPVDGPDRRGSRRSSAGEKAAKRERR